MEPTLNLPPAPLSPAAERAKGTMRFARCEAYDDVLREIRRYVNGEILGRAVLVAGHRGSGKTTLVHSAIAIVQHDAELAEAAVLARPRSDELRDWLRRRLFGRLPPPTKTPRTLRPLPVFLHGHDLLGTGSKSDVPQHALEVVNRGLCRAYLSEVGRNYRQRVRERGDLPGLEAAAQLDLDLDVGADLGRLRQYWKAGHFLRRGVLHRAPYHEAQGWRELAVLEALNHAASVGKEAARSAAEPPKEPVREFVELLLRGKSWAKLGGALFFGLIAAAVAALLKPNNEGLIAMAFCAVFCVVLVALTQIPQENGQKNLLGDNSVASFDVALPILIDRLSQIGLAPIFIVDELDKVPDIEERLGLLIRRCKHFVGDRSFFCFLVGRRYFEHLRVVGKDSPFPPDAGYFQTRAAIHYSPDELHRYCLAAQKPQTNQVPDAAAEDSRDPIRHLLNSILLFNSRMHVSSIERHWSQILRSGESGEKTCQAKGNLLRLIAQASVEVAYYGELIQNRLRFDPWFGQIVYDTLYYPARHWTQYGNYGSGTANANALDISVEAFRKYLEERSATEDDPAKRLARKPDPPWSAADLGLLHQAMTEVVGYLEEPEKLLGALKSMVDCDPRTNRPWLKATLDALTDPKAPHKVYPLLQKQEKDTLRLWSFTPAGNPAPIPVKPGKKAEEIEKAELLLELDLLLRDFSLGKLTLEGLVGSYGRYFGIADQRPCSHQALNRIVLNDYSAGQPGLRDEDTDSSGRTYDAIARNASTVCHFLMCASARNAADLNLGAEAVRAELNTPPRVDLNQVAARLLSDDRQATQIAATAQLGVQHWIGPLRRWLSNRYLPAGPNEATLPADHAAHNVREFIR